MTGKLFNTMHVMLFHYLQESEAAYYPDVEKITQVLNPVVESTSENQKWKIHFIDHLDYNNLDVIIMRKMI